MWFTIPFALATSLGLASTALQLPITADEAGQGLVPPAVATFLFGEAGALMISIMLFMAIVSTGSAEAIAISSLVSYDIYREYINPNATGDDILKLSQKCICFFCIIMGLFSCILFWIGLGLGWVYLFMGIVIGSAVIPLWNMMMWKDANATGAVIAAWAGQISALVVWFITAASMEGEISVASLGGKKVTRSCFLKANAFRVHLPRLNSYVDTFSRQLPYACGQSHSDLPLRFHPLRHKQDGAPELRLEIYEGHQAHRR